jgi:hypothetical protein
LQTFLLRVQTAALTLTAPAATPQEEIQEKRAAVNQMIHAPVEAIVMTVAANLVTKSLTVTTTVLTLHKALQIVSHSALRSLVALIPVVVIRAYPNRHLALGFNL